MFLQKWQRYAALRAKAEHAAEAAKKASAEMRIAESELIDAMLDDEIKSWTDESGARVQTVRHFGISCTQENADLVEEWLRETAGDAEQFKVSKLDKSAIEAYLKRLVEEEGTPQDDIPEFFRLSTRPGIRVNGWEAYKKALGT